jgi:uncharacterized integral membrane protein
MKNLTKTLIFTFIISLLMIISAFFVQVNANNKTLKCSYFDPVIVDILAFFGAFFLIIEGFYRIFEHKTKSLKNQISRSIRIAFGFSIITLHIIQLLNK